MKRLMMIGFGAMAAEVIRLLPEELELGWVLITERSRARVSEEILNLRNDSMNGNTKVITSVDQCDATPDLVVECAGQQSVRMHGVAILEKGWDLALISVGALANNALATELYQAAEQSGARLHALSGAVAGIDALASAKEAGLEQVTYCCCKGPKSWQGGPAEQYIDLSAVTERQVFFEGTAREAALTFPANANVAATVALASLGLDETRVQLVVDPAVNKNQHRIQASGVFGSMEICVAGVPLAANPKTSTLAALSVVRACRQAVSPLIV